MTVLAPSSVRWLVITMILVLLPHLPRVPWWLGATSLALAVWRLLAVERQWPLPGRWIRIALTSAAVGGVFAVHGSWAGRDAGVALLVALAGLKLVEMTRTRDVFVVIFLGYFLVITHFLYSQGIMTTLYMLLGVLLFTATLVDINRRRAASEASLRRAGQLLAQALPLAAVLFVLFPRVEGPLWPMPDEAYGARSGLSGDMDPGTISQLSLSARVAFRARFQGQIPTPDKRYWRGPVLWHTDGNRWSVGADTNGTRLTAPDFQQQGEPRRHTITLEPHNQRWLFALDRPASEPRGVAMSTGLHLVSKERVRQRRRYQVTSYTQYRDIELTPSARQRALQLPQNGNPQARDLAQRWRQQHDQDHAIVETALGYFRNQAFVYTLNPPQVQGEFVDGFLFDSQRGFCEHFAASFTFLMRAAGIPARVVTGYQGGEFNTFGEYLVIRQRDAHAWSEVWLPGQGWRRVDPTAAVAPERLEQGIAAVASEIGEPVEFAEPGATGSSLHRLGRWLHQGWGALNSTWQETMIAYGPQRQLDLLAWLGLSRLAWPTQVGLLATMAVLAVITTVLILARPRQRVDDPTGALYQRFCHKLARRGLPRQPAEGPQDYATRASQTYPDLADQITAITNLYVGLRYRRRADPRWQTELRRQVRRFRP